MKIISSILFLITAIIVSCSQGYIVNLTEKTDYPEGRELYLSKCNGCHRLYSPLNYSVEKWDSILPSMQLKSKITDSEKELIHNWILERIMVLSRTKNK